MKSFADGWWVESLIPRLALLLVATAVAQPTRAQVLPSVRDSAGVRIVESRAATWTTPWRIDTVPLARIGDTSGRPEYELFRVTDARRLPDGSVVIANAGSNEVRWYSSSGAFIRGAGRNGSGPGEFLSIAQVFLLPEDSVAALDVRQRRLTIFGPDGSLGRTLRIDHPAQPVMRFEDGTYLLITGFVTRLGAEGPVRVERDPLDVYRLAERSTVPQHILATPGLEFAIGPTGGITREGTIPIGRNPREFGRQSFVAAIATGWVVGENDRAEIQYRLPGGELAIIARWNASIRSVTPADVEADRALALSRQDDPAVRARMREAWTTRPDPHETMPAFGGLLVDAEGNVWAKEYSPPAETDRNRHYILSPEGEWLGIIQAPPGMRILSVGADWVLGVTQDALDIETVTLHRLTKR